MKKLYIMLLAMLLCVVSGYAQTFEVDGILYNVTKQPSDESSGEVEVGQKTDGYTGDIIIPAEVTFEDKTYEVTSIGYSAFSGCTNLSSITIPNSVIRIGDLAFDNCTSLSSVTFSSSVTSIGERTFYGCSSLNDVKIIVMDYSEFCNKHIIAQLFNINCPIQLIDNDGNEITEYIIPEGVTTIGAGTFTNCSGLTSIIIPNSVTVIEDACIKKQHISYNSYSTTYCGVFEGCTSLSSITIPNSVTSIGERAFYSCSGMKMVKSEISTPFTVNAFTSIFNIATLIVPKGSRADYKSVGGWNFAYTYEEGETIYDREKADEQGVQYTLEQAEDGNIYYSVTGHSEEMNAEIVIPADLDGCPVRAIGRAAFQNCRGLSTCTIPNSVTSIGDGAFNNCSSLLSITISSSVTSIGEKPFFGCSSLNNIMIVVMDYFEFCNNNIVGKIVKLSSSDIQLINNEGIEIREYDIPEGVTTIGESAFVRCSGLTSITIPNSVTSIGGSAFSSCSALTSITIPNSVTSIGGSAFSGSGLTSITIPSSVTSIGHSIFSSCKRLTSITIPNSVTSIGTSAFSSSGLTSVTIPNSVRSIGESAFYNCSGLISVTIGNSVTTIYESAFRDCSGLTSVILGNSVTSIGKNAFWNCGSLTSISIPSSVKSIGTNTFANCSKLKNVKVVVMDYSEFCNNTIVAKLHDAIYELRAGTIQLIDEDGNEIREYIIPEGVTTISERAFKRCRGLTSITIPNGVTSIGESAFYDCAGLKMVKSEILTPFAVNAFNSFNATLVVPKGLSAAYKNASGWDFAFIFEEGSVYDREHTDEQGIRYTLRQADDNSFYYSVTGHSNEMNAEIVIPANLGDCPVRTIEGNVFNGCADFTSITIPNSVTSIGQDAFKNCSGLRIVKSEISVPFAINAFGGCFDATLVVPKGSREDYKNVSGWAFAVILEEGETIYDREQTDEQGVQYTLKQAEDGSIYYSVTGHSNELNTEIVIPADLDGCPVTAIESRVFQGCTNLSSITIPNSMTSIGQDAFKNCSGLRIVKSEIPTPFAVDAFSGSFNATLIVPKGSRANYKDMSGWEFTFIYEEGETIYNNEQTDEQGLYYSLKKTDDGSAYYSVTGHSDELNTEIVIPTDLDGCPVRAIEGYVFYGCTSLSSITIPNSVTSIGNYAFYGCSGLTSITIPNSVTSIGNFVFLGCSGLTSVTIPESVISIGDYAFGSCSSLTSIIIGNGVTSIGEYAFRSCNSLTSVIIGNSVTSIRDDAFNGCSSLSSITIPNTLKIGGAFYSCSGLNDVKVIVMDYSLFCSNIVININGRLYDGTIQLLDSDGNEITEYIIPEGVTTIDDNAFKNCNGLTSIIIPNSVTAIGNYAFSGCSSLSSITIPNSVVTIGIRAFNECSGLRTVISEISTPYAVSAAFNSCDAILVVPKGSRADYNSVSGWDFTIIYEDGETIYDREQTDEQGVQYTLKQAEDGSIYYSVTGHSNELNTEIVIPADLDGCPVTAIESRVFQGCTNLSSIIIPNSVTSIGGSAFYGCSGLTYISIGRGITSIEAATFYGCSGLTTITIPNSVTNIKDGYHGYLYGQHAYFGAFSGCSSLVSVTIGNGMTSIGSYAFYGCSGLVSVKMGRKVCSIGDCSFQGCSSLAFIALPNTLENIGYGAFLGSSLESVNIPESVETIGNEAFKSCGNLASVSFEDGIVSIGDDAFNGCALTTVTIPNSVTTIGGAAFANNSNLRTAILGDGITAIKQGMFSGCYFLSSIKIPDGVTSIGNRAFWDCQCLASIKLPESLTFLGNEVFYRSILRSIELPNSFTVIPENCFSGNNLQYIKLGNNVKSIGKNAFGSSNPVIEIGTSTPPTIASDAFPNIEYLADINVIVPNAAAETAYRKAAVWNEMTFSNQNNNAEVTVDTPGELSWELLDECNMMPAKVVGLKVNGTINADDFTQMLVNMKSLLRLDLSDCNITVIPDNAMKGKAQLQELTLPIELQAIGESAFQDCTFLTDLTMQNSLHAIGKSAFKGCISLSGELNLPSTLTSIGETAFVGSSYSSVKLPATLQTISDNAFKGVPIKQQLVLPGSVISVGTSAFEGTKIESLSIPRSVITIGNRAFANTQIMSLTIKDGVKSIGDEAFASTPIQGHVTIPDGVTYLGVGAFRNSQLETVFLPNSITMISQGLFQGCPNLNIVYIPDNFTAMSNYAFDGCGALTILRLSANTASMGEYSLQNTPLDYVKVPAPVEVLPRGVLKNCKNLESLSLPANLTMVESEALYGCTALRNLSVEALTPPTIKDLGAIRGINTDKCLISIPTQSYKKYVLAEYWGQFVQMRNDIAVETVGNGKIGFESADEEEEGEEASYARRHGRHSAAAHGRRGAAPQLAEDEDSLTYANNGSSVYVPQQGKVRFYIIPAEGEEILSATLDGEDIMPYIVDGVYTATADKKNAKLVVVFSDGQGSAGLLGDVNGDGDVSVTDVGCVINYILEQVPDSFIPAAADMNSDGSISVTDVGFIINYILNDGAAFCRAEHNATYSYGLPMLMQDADGYILTLDGADAFIGFQMDIFVPEDADGYSVRLKNTGTDHQMACRRLGNGHFRVVCYSPTNETFAEGLTDLLAFASEGDVTISNIRFTTESLDEVRFADMSATPTSIASVTDVKTTDIKVYTLEGQLYRTVHARPGENPLKDLHPGIYLINNRKYIIR